MANLRFQGSRMTLQSTELIPHFSKCGIIMDEILTGSPVSNFTPTRREPERRRFNRLQEESVNLALNILDESEIRPSVRIKVQEASFNKMSMNRNKVM